MSVVSSTATQSISKERIRCNISGCSLVQYFWVINLGKRDHFYTRDQSYDEHTHPSISLLKGILAHEMGHLFVSSLSSLLLDIIL